MALAIGHKLGIYEIVAPVGVGGMGESRETTGGRESFVEDTAAGNASRTVGAEGLVNWRHFPYRTVT